MQSRVGWEQFPLDNGFWEALDGNGFGNETRRNRGDDMERAVMGQTGDWP
jgi:hypothetical protein